MPIALDPDQTYPVALAIDTPKPEAERPEFLFRFLTCREVRRVVDLRREAMQLGEAADKEADIDKRDAMRQQSEAKLHEALTTALKGWRNMGREYSPDALDDVLTISEKWELACVFLARGGFAEDEKKASASRLSSVTASCAVPVTGTAVVA